jgi:hypothetical protein
VAAASVRKMRSPTILAWGIPADLFYARPGGEKGALWARTLKHSNDG